MRNREGQVIECVAFVAAKCDMQNVEQVRKLELQQEMYIRKYAKAHGVKVIGVIHSCGQAQFEVNKKFNQIVELIRKGRVQGIITINMRMLSHNLVDAYCKVGKVRSAGGEMITVDEGRLRLDIWRNERNER